VISVTDGRPLAIHDCSIVEALMTGISASARTLCLLNENAQCNPIWVSQPDGLKLLHFPTLQQELTGREHLPVDTAYENCERLCVQGGHL
jgi:hypothetical protein